MWADYRDARTLRKRELFGELADQYFALYWSQTVRELAARALVPPIPQVGEPVTTPQIEKAAQILAANSRRNGVWVADNTINWSVATVQLQDVLSPAQIAALGNAIRAKRMSAEVQGRMRRLTSQFNAQVRPQ